MEVPFKVDMEIHDQGNLSWASSPSPVELTGYEEYI
jgi:hypothetical protein